MSVRGRDVQSTSANSVKGLKPRCQIPPSPVCVCGGGGDNAKGMRTAQVTRGWTHVMCARLLNLLYTLTVGFDTFAASGDAARNTPTLTARR